MTKMTSTVLALVFSASAGAGAGNWTPVAIPGGANFATQYVGAGVALTTTNHNVYRTTDHGANWTLVQALPSASAAKFAVNPANASQVLLVSGGLMRSTNGGESFSAVGWNGGVNTPIYGVAAFSHDGNFAFVVGGTGICLRSVDGGVTWERLDGVLPAAGYTSMARDSVDRDTLYVRGNTGMMYRSRDACATWTRVGGTQTFLGVRASPDTPGLLLAITGTNLTPARSADYGDSWTVQSAPQQLGDFAFMPGGQVAAGGRAQSNIFTSNDAGLTWTDRGRRPNARASGLTFDPAEPARVLGASDAGPIGSDDGGQTWSERVKGMRDANTYDIGVARDGSNLLYIATADLASIYRRDPATGAFTGVARASTPLLGYPDSPDTLSDFRIVVSPTDGNTVYLIRDGFIGRSTDGGTTWTVHSNTVPIKTLAFDPTNTQVAYSGGFSGNFKSTNGGMTWVPMSNSLPGSVQRFLIDPTNTSILYAMPDQSTSPVYKSIDAGASWTRVPWPAMSPNVSPDSLILEPDRPTTLYLLEFFGLHKSTDSAATWSDLRFGASFATAGHADIIADPQNSTVLYVTSPTAETLRSVDGGSTWTGLAPQTPWDQLGFRRIALVPGHNARLIGLRQNGGVFEIDVTPHVNISLTGNSMTATQAGTLQISLNNAGVPAATRLKLAGTLPAASSSYTVQGTGLVCAVNVRELSCEAAALSPGATATASVAFTPSGAGNATLMLTAYETLAAASIVSAPVTVAAAPSTSSSSGGGNSSGSGGGKAGGGRLDYLLLAMLAAAAAARLRVGGRPAGGEAARMR